MTSQQSDIKNSRDFDQGTLSAYSLGKEQVISATGGSFLEKFVHRVGPDFVRYL